MFTVINSKFTVIYYSVGRKFVIHQQDVELTIPVMEEFSQILDVFPIMQLKFSDLQGNVTSHHKFKLNEPPGFLKINEINGEIYFDRDKWPQRKQVKKLKAIVQNIETGAKAKTFLTFNFVTLNKTEFCIEHSCFYDNIGFFTPEFNTRKNNEEQIIGNLNSPLYRRICKSYQEVYFLNDGEQLHKNFSRVES